MPVRLTASCVRNEQCQSCQSCGTDGKTFTHSSCCVTNCIQLICDLTDALIQTGHLGDTAGVVGDRTVSVNCNGDSCCGKHAYCRKSDTVKAGKLVSNKDTYADQDDRELLWNAYRQQDR